MTKAKWSVLAISSFCALVQFRLIAFVLGDGFVKSGDVAHGVVIGRPHWRVYQSRVLGPYLVEGLSRLLNDYYTAHVCYVIITLTVAGCLSYAVGRQLAGRMGGALVFAVFQLGFAFLLSQPWLYAWDYLDLIIFFAFIDFVLRRKTLPWFVGLFAVGIFNRESALFIALWLVLDPIARRLTEPSGLERRRLDRRSIVAGVCCLAAGSAVIAGLRSALLIEETGPRLFGFTLSRPAIEVLAWNLGLARQYFLHPDFYMPFTVPLFLMGTVLIAIVVARRWPRQLLGLSLIHVAMVGALLTIGYLPETRVYLDLLPFIATACVLITAQEVDIVG